MKKFLISAFILLTSCISNVSYVDTEFPDDISFSEFKLKLKEYAQNKPYPSLENDE